MYGLKNFSLIFAVLILAFALFSGYLVHRDAGYIDDNHFVLLAQSFLNNDLFLSPDNLPPGDYADFLGKQYLFFGPLPSVVLVPFVFIFGAKFPQYLLSFVSLLVTYIVVYGICSRLKFNKIDAIWLANFFVFGTVLYFVGLVNISAYLVQAVGILFVVLAIFEYFGSRRWFVIGALVALASLTRLTLIGSVVFFALELAKERNKEKFGRYMILLLLPVVFSLMLLGAYNLRRFHSAFDTGYTRNVTVVNSPSSNSVRGAFGLVHVPGNLYGMLFAAPDVVKAEAVDFVLRFPYLKVNGIALAILFTSPLFLFLIKAKKKPFTMSALGAVVFLMIPSLIYFGIGTTQFGYRYSLDFQPFLFLILLGAFENKVDRFAKLLITFGILFNSLYMASIWNSYPVYSFFGLL